MRRWLTVFLLILLPLQLSWAVAATYCAHEADPAVSHVGHHQHQHEDAPAASPDASVPTDPAGPADPSSHAGSAKKSESASASDSDSEKASDKVSEKALTCVDDDCGFCHLGHTQPVASTPIELPAVSAPVSRAFTTDDWSSRGPDRRERPNWRLA